MTELLDFTPPDEPPRILMTNIEYTMENLAREMARNAVERIQKTARKQWEKDCG